MTYQELKAALEIFGITERASIEQIKQRHRELVKRHHPDQCVGADPALIRKINVDYEILTTYCAAYRCCFSEEEYLEQNPRERLRRQFKTDPLWGNRQEGE